jgi:integrase
MVTMIKVLCYKSKTLSNGEHPLMLRVTKAGNRKYESLGLSVQEKHWDFEKEMPKKNCPNRDEIMKIISDKENEYSERIIENKAIKKEFTASSLVDSMQSPVKPRTVKEMFDEVIKRLKSADKLNTAASYRHLRNSMLKFNRHLNIYFSDIDVTWLKRYEAFLQKNGNSPDTIGIRMRTLRALYSDAIEEDIVKEGYYPFNKFKVSHYSQSKRNVSLSEKEIVTIMKFNPIRHYYGIDYTALALDIFKFMYYAGGINFNDLARLTLDNIQNNTEKEYISFYELALNENLEIKVVYKRHKSKKIIDIPLHPKALQIIDSYRTKDSMYLFPILNASHITEQKKYNKIRKDNKKIDEALKEIGKQLNLSISLTTGEAKNAFATTLKRAGINTAMISEFLGHSSEKVTQHYMDKFGHDQAIDAFKKLGNWEKPTLL